MENFEYFGNDFGLGGALTPYDGIAIDDKSRTASGLYACLVAEHFRRRFLDEYFRCRFIARNLPQQGYCLISRADFEAWVDDAFPIFVPAGLFSDDEASERGLAVEDFVPYINYGSRVLAKRA
jgi:hypothetical protein